MLPFQVHQHKEPFVVSGHCETEKASQVSERNACQVPQSDLENLTREGRRVTECQFLIGVQFWDKDHTAMVLKQNVPNSKCCPQGPQIAVPHGTSTRNAKDLHSWTKDLDSQRQLRSYAAVSPLSTKRGLLGPKLRSYVALPLKVFGESQWRQNSGPNILSLGLL